MKEQIDNIFSRYKTTGRVLGFKYPKDGLTHGICLIVINFIVQLLNTYTHASMIDGKIEVEGSSMYLTIIDIVTFVIGFWLLNTAFIRFTIKRAVKLTEADLVKKGVVMNDDIRLELIHLGCAHFEMKESTLSNQLSYLLRIITLALTLSVLQGLVVALILTI